MNTIYSLINQLFIPTTSEGKFIALREVNSPRSQLEKYRNLVQILQTVNCTVHSSNQEKLAALEILCGQFNVNTLCEALKVPRGTFYNHIFRGKHGDTINARRRAELRTAIYDIFHEYDQLFGAGKITAILRERGYCTSDKLVTELMGEMGLISVTSSAKRMYYKWQKGENKNILQQRFHVIDPNKVWVSDITTFKYRETYYYIAAIIDLFSRKVIAYKISKQNSTQVVTSAFRAVYRDRALEPGLIFHSDRGA
ncbi:MAG: IS3 family transposase [Lachnospiraceae bacterium]